MRTPFIAGNWKMHKTLAEARELVEGIKERTSSVSEVDILLCPPVYLLFPMAKSVAGTNLKLGAQNVHDEPKGAFTGDRAGSSGSRLRGQWCRASCDCCRRRSPDRES